MARTLALVVVLAALPSVLSAASQEAVELRNLGLALLENEREGKAEDVYHDLVALLPDEPLGHANLAIALLRQLKTEEALAEIDEALRLAPDRPDLLAIRGAVLDWHGEREAALTVFEKAARAAPTDTETLYVLWKQASSLPGPEAEQAAAWAIERLCELRPENLFVLLQRGRTALDTGDRATATETYLRVRELLWQAPQVAQEQLELVMEGLEAGDLSTTRRPSIILENVLKPEIMYQRGLDDVRTKIQGIPLEDFEDESPTKTFGTPVAVRFRAQVLDETPTRRQALALADLDADGRTDIARIVDDEAGSLLEIRLAADDYGVTRTLSAPPANGLLAFDLDNDGNLDLLAIGDRTTLWLGRGDGSFDERSADWGLDIGTIRAAAAFDFDIEGDLDLAAAPLEGAGLELYRNSLDGPLTPIGERSLPKEMEIRGITAIVPTDLDRDGDLDLLLVHSTGVALLDNLRQGRFRDATRIRGLDVLPVVRDATSIDLDNDGWPEIVTVGEEMAVYGNRSGSFAKWVLSGDARRAGSYDDVTAFDADNDGRADLLLGGPSGLRILGNAGDGAFLSFSIENLPQGLTFARPADLDFDGDLDLVATGPAGLYRLENIGGNQNHWLRVQLRGLAKGDGKNNFFGLGSTLELFLGEAYQFREVTEPIMHLGLGENRCPDLLRVVWTNGVPQNRIGCPENDQSVVEEQILKGSCPFLYTWNGDKIDFVTDLLWGAPLGMPIAEGQWAAADPQEIVHLPGAQSIEGIYDLRITEELWEAAFFDHVRLWIVDHPVETEIASTLRVVPGESIDDRIVAAASVRPVQAAWDGEGRNVTERVRKRDDIYAGGYPIGRYQGVTPRPWSFTFDLGQEQSDIFRLFLDGWIFPADASLNLAVSQRREPPILTRLEALTTDGWEVVLAKLGHPAGKTKTMVIDVPKHTQPLRRLRIVSSKWLAWDRIAWSRDLRDDQVLVRARLDPLRADLRYRGFSRRVRVSPNAPHTYDYGLVSENSPWLPFPGSYTRYGDVRELLLEADDRSVILAPGDELRLTFDASGLEPVAAGWKREVFLESHGWDKDADRNTYAPEQMEPLPFRAMSGYPFAEGESFPDTLEMRAYRESWLSRTVESQKGVPGVPSGH